MNDNEKKRLIAVFSFFYIYQKKLIFPIYKFPVSVYNKNRINDLKQNFCFYYKKKRSDENEAKFDERV